METLATADGAHAVILPRPAPPQRLQRKRLMRAAIISSPGKAHTADIPLPQPRAGEVRVRLEGCGVCGSNLPSWEGRPWFQYPLAPGQLGHEGWGRVDELGQGVSNFRPGQRVALLSQHAYAEYDLAPEEALVPLPARLDGLPFPGEALGCAMNIFRCCDIFPQQTVAILGIGFLGATLTALCARAGARVLAVSRRPFALGIARKMGAAETFSMAEPRHVLDRIKSITAGRLCDCVIEVTGRQVPLDLAGELTREGGRLVIAGYHQDGLRQVNLQLWNWRALRIINAHERNPAVCVAGIRSAVEAVASGWFDPTPLYTHTFRLEQLGQALDAMSRRPPDFLKALILTPSAESK